MKKRLRLLGCYGRRVVVPVPSKYGICDGSGQAERDRSRRTQVPKDPLYTLTTKCVYCEPTVAVFSAYFYVVTDRHAQKQSCLSRTRPMPDTVTYLPNDGYTMSDPSTTTFTAPFSNQCYSHISKDFNPIHVNPYFSDIASLPGTITHDMWTSAASRKYLESVVAKGRPE